MTPRTIRRWGAAGVLERIQLGDRLTRYSVESVEALIHPSTSEATGAQSDGFAKTGLAGADQCNVAHRPD